VLEGTVKRNKLTAIVISVSLSVIFAGVCGYFFLLHPVRTTTFTGSSAHWNVKYVVQSKKLDKDFHMSSHTKFEVWWTGTPGAVTETRYQLTGLHGAMADSTMNGSFNPWVNYSMNALVSEQELKWGLRLTITWKGGTETLSLQRH